MEHEVKLLCANAWLGYLLDELIVICRDLRESDMRMRLLASMDDEDVSDGHYEDVITRLHNARGRFLDINGEVNQIVCYGLDQAISAGNNSM